ncbi:hypothetical protein BGZ83_002519 [Gryganskiella cystojenkinii]|nr:hypothetical protein BGZ83_002519 [Gryganskiella cystojenkinii]
MAFLNSFISATLALFFFTTVLLSRPSIAVPTTAPDLTLPITLTVVHTDGTRMTLIVLKSACVELPATTSSFYYAPGPSTSTLTPASSDQNTVPLFAIYQDTNCQSYLYSVAAQLNDFHGVALSLSWTASEPPVSTGEVVVHIPGVAFVDPLLTSTPQKKDTKHSYLIQIVIVSLGAALVFVGVGLYLCLRDNSKLFKKGTRGYSDSQQGRPSMAEMSGPGRSVYQYESQHHRRHSTSGGSAASSVSYLPPYGAQHQLPQQQGRGIVGDSKELPSVALSSPNGLGGGGENPPTTPAGAYPENNILSSTTTTTTGTAVMSPSSLPTSPNQPPPVGFSQDLYYHQQQPQPQSPSQKQALDFPALSPPALITTRARSYSNLTNRVGTGAAGFDPDSVPQGRNAGFGFGLGYDLEELELGRNGERGGNNGGLRDRLRDSDMMMMSEAMESPQASPHLRPSSALSMDLPHFHDEHLD